MARSITITVALFGAFRDAHSQPHVTLEMPHGSGIAALRHALGEQFGSLVNQSALADDSRILPDYTTFENDAQLAILPPVCGG